MNLQHHADEINRVVEAWHTYSDAKQRSVPNDAASRFREYFPRFTMRGFTTELRSFMRRDRTDQMHALGGYFQALGVTEGSPQPQLSPLVRFYMRIVSGEIELMVRMAVLFVDPSERREDRYGAITAHGWRFESADIPGGEMGDGTGDGFHHYPHVQPINAWEKKGKGLFPVEWTDPIAGAEALVAPDWNEARPAIPLRCSRPAGVVIAAMTALYGSNTTHRILETTARDKLRQELEEVTGLPQLRA